MSTRIQVEGTTVGFADGISVGQEVMEMHAHGIGAINRATARTTVNLQGFTPVDKTQPDAPLSPKAPQALNVLDHGFVRLVDHMGSDLSIVRAARVSYDADWRVGNDAGKDEKLIKYLMLNAHTSPFEAVTFTFEVKAPIFVFRQWHRHRTWSFNEVSARYSELPEEFYIPDASVLTTQHKSNKQMRTDEQVANVGLVQAYMTKANADAFALYHTLIGQGVARELARTVLPLATYSRMFGTVNLHNLLRFLALRLHPHAQHEIRVYAEAMLELVRPIVPHSLAAFEEMSNAGL